MTNADPSPEVEIERLRQEVRRQSEQANAEFEEFISMTAHDLREPLRDVAANSQLLAETCAARLDADAVVFLDRIQQAAVSAQTILAAVVDYWDNGNGGRQPSPTDMETVLCQALLRAGKQIDARHAIVTHDPMPRVCGDLELLTKVLHHLIRNAIEYGSATSPQVHVSSRRVDSGMEISVSDNGPGIEPALQGRVFGPFKRLHGREYPGNGLGLAFCKKAIEGLGGRLWVESVPGSGATFSFTLPAA